MAMQDPEYLSDEFLDILPERLRRMFEMTGDRNSPNPGIDTAQRSSLPLLNQDARVTQLRPENEERNYDSDGVNQRSVNQVQNAQQQQLRRSNRSAAKDADFQRREQLGIQTTPKVKAPKLRDRKLLRSLHENVLEQRRE